MQRIWDRRISATFDIAQLGLNVVLCMMLIDSVLQRKLWWIVEGLMMTKSETSADLQTWNHHAESKQIIQTKHAFQKYASCRKKFLQICLQTTLYKIRNPWIHWQWQVNQQKQQLQKSAPNVLHWSFELPVFQTPTLFFLFCSFVRKRNNAQNSTLCFN